MMASVPRIILESGQHQHSPVPFPSLHTNPSQLDAKHTPNPFTPHALAIPSHRMPFSSLHTACPPCTGIITNPLEKITQKWRISKRWRSTLEVQTAQLDPRHMLCKYCAYNRVRLDCEVAAEKADFTTMSDKHARTSPGLVPHRSVKRRPAFTRSCGHCAFLCNPAWFPTDHGASTLLRLA